MLISVVTFVVAIHAAGIQRGLLMGFVMTLCAAVLPYGLLQIGIRRGIWSDRHMSRRDQRPAVLAIGLASNLLGLLVLLALGAPRSLFALVAGICVAVAVCLGVTLWWKISIHTACAGGVVAALTVLVSAWSIFLNPLVVLVGWSRVTLRDHTALQVIVGGVVGYAVGVAVTSVGMVI
ncbi:hypothetical protein [Leekyejoonella antrihumi]|uniref:Phosphatase PAP2 family protein n=1 Tax=Leekyejoonella antrihumi TaxID=1660198 RepID=A0A563E841_9MICO|nr:hypothetical protein [Leekyejoonella antrihumi]TWP37994.1 hypothetical protein FGL98_04610 [Leekyejoonella antrihumi]